MGSRLTIACVVAGRSPGGGARGAQPAESLPAQGAGPEEALPRVPHRLRAEAEEAGSSTRRSGAGECSRMPRPARLVARQAAVGRHARDLRARATTASIPANAKSAHKVVADGDCEKCHDPHASDNPANLLAKGNDLCFGCHKELGDAIKKAKFKHSPVEQGCLTCHGPHGSDKSVRLLKNAVPALCVNCHKPDTPAFVARHMKYPVAQGVLHVLPRPARLEPAGAAAEQRARAASATARAPSATRPRIPPRPSRPSAPATSCARGVTTTW